MNAGRHGHPSTVAVSSASEHSTPARPVPHLYLRWLGYRIAPPLRGPNKTSRFCPSLGGTAQGNCARTPCPSGEAPPRDGQGVSCAGFVRRFRAALPPAAHTAAGGAPGGTLCRTRGRCWRRGRGGASHVDAPTPAAPAAALSIVLSCCDWRAWWMACGRCASHPPRVHPRRAAARRSQEHERHAGQLMSHGDPLQNPKAWAGSPPAPGADAFMRGSGSSLRDTMDSWYGDAD